MFKWVKKGLAVLIAVTLVFGAVPQGILAAADQNVEEKVNQTLSALSLADRVSLMYGGSAAAGAGATQIVSGLDRMNMSDGPNGVNAGGTGTSFSSGLIVSATWNPDHAREVGRIIGAEAKAKNVQIMLGPGVNIIRDLAGGRTFEYYSEDPVLTGKIGAAYVEGMQSQEVSATVKHLFANNQESNRNWSTSNLSERAIHEIYLPPYKAAITQGGAWSMMTGANRVNGVFTSDNRYILTNMMKYDYGLEGIIMTDWCGVRSNVISAKAGLDVSMPRAGPYAGLLDAVRSGLLPSQVVDTSAQRVARLAYYTKTTTNANGFRASDRSPGESYNVGSHANESVELAKEGEVLLKNDGLLPFTKTSPTIALLGKYVAYNFEQSGLGGSSSVIPPTQVHSGAALRNLYNNHIAGGATFLEPTYSEANENDIDTSVAAAVEAAKQADYVVIFAGINKSRPEHQEGNAPDTEGNDRVELDFPAAQLRLIQAVSAVAGQKTVVVLNGSVFEVVDWVDDVNAVLTTFYPGQNGATATADILVGFVNPSGKLPFTWPKRYEDTQGYVPNVPEGGNQETVKNVEANYAEGVFEGYRYYDLRLHDNDPANDIQPQFAFGHGLSYATYNWSGVTLSASEMGPEGTLTASVTLTNTNGVAGKQVVQLYVRDPVSSVPRPWKELKNFQKKSIVANGSQTFTFEIDKDDLSFWDVNTHSMKAEAGTFNILIGDASDSIRAEATITLTADSAPDPNYTVVQAEDYDAQSGVTIGEAFEVDSAVSHAPNQYVMLGGVGAFATWSLTAPEAGKYSLIFRYSNDAFSGNINGTTEGHNRLTELVVNGEPSGVYDFQNTRRADVWNYDSIDVVLDAGVNTVTLRGTDRSAGVRVDKLIAQKIEQRWPDPVASADMGGGLTPTDDNVFEAETATLLTGAVVDTAAAGYSGEGYVNLRGVGSSATIPVYAPTSVRFRIQVTYSNGLDSPVPCDLYVNGVKKYTYTFGPTGSDSTWRYEQTDEITMLTGTNTLLFDALSGAVNLDKIEIIGGMGYLDTEAPVVNGTSPGDGGRWLNDVSAYYSEAVEAGPGSVTITDADANVIPSSFTVSGVKLAVTPDAAHLQSGMTYTVTIDPNAALDTSGNGLAEPYAFTFLVPPANYNDPSIVYSGTWTDTGAAKSAGTDASLNFWYYGNEAVLRAAQDDEAVVNVWFDDVLTPESVTLTDTDGKTAAFYNAADQAYGLHYVKVDVTSGTLNFVGANVNAALVEQPYSKAGWQVTGVRDNYPSTDGLNRIVDDNRASRWTSGAAQSSANRDWFAIEFAEPLDINALLLTCRTSNVGSTILDYTRAYECFVSDDGIEWIGPVAAGPGSPMFTNIVFPTQTTRFIKVVQTGNTSSWWSVYEAYGFKLPEEVLPKLPPPTAPTGLAATRINRQIKLTWNAADNVSGVRYYEVLRDGEPVARTSGTGYVDMIDEGDATEHVYTVVLIDILGGRSNPSNAVTASSDPLAVNIPRAGWQASASHAHSSTPPQNAIDADEGSRMTTGTGIAPGMWITVDMGLAYKFNAITIKSNVTDYPTAYEIVSSNDGATWSEPLASGAGVPNAINVILTEPATARYIRINQTGAARGDWWSIFDINVAFYDTLDCPQQLTAAGYNGFIRLDWFPPVEGFFTAHHYDVYRDGVLIQGNWTSARYVDVNVRPNKLYTYEIVAIAADGENSPKSAAASARYQAAKTEIPKANWSAAASVSHTSHPPDLVYDNIDVIPNRTKWSSGAMQDGTQVFYLHLNDVYPVDTLRISSDTADYGREYTIKALVGGEWETLVTDAAGQAGVQEFTFDTVYTNEFQICNTGVNSGQYWSIYELYVLNAAAPASIWSIDDVTVSSDEVLVAISRGASQGAASVILAAYSADGRLLAVQTEAVTRDGVYVFDAPPANAATVKVFLWDSAHAPLDAAWSRQF
ncbi:MAG: glycoside hydrolase family 3 C-terminal domain-containing protein [Oscillospiraceae bacterium]|jgi:beta-glucosidase|nr:glycoside hydrolase family 3 C-terminal domain-containing protein [Oscillospiraceae bacterium]